MFDDMEHVAAFSASANWVGNEVDGGLVAKVAIHEG